MQAPKPEGDQDESKVQHTQISDFSPCITYDHNIAEQFKVGSALKECLSPPQVSGEVLDPTEPVPEQCAAYGGGEHGHGGREGEKESSWTAPSQLVPGHRAAQSQNLQLPHLDPVPTLEVG